MTNAPSDEHRVLLIARHRFGGRPPLGDWQMARALSRRARVLYIEPPNVVRRPTRGTLRQMRAPDLRHVSPSLTAVRPLAFPGASRPTAAAVTDRLYARQVQIASDAVLGPRPTMVSFDPLRGDLRGIERDLLVYWQRDRFAAYPTKHGPHLARRERRILRSAQLVSCVSPDLIDDALALAQGKVVHIPNGCDAEHFAHARARPPGLPDAERVIGFVTGSAWRSNLPLLYELASSRPNWAFVIVGTGDRTPTGLPGNVHLIPYVDYDDVPAWMQHLDVGLVAYDVASAFNRSSFPLKALEYLAAGVPVVSTPIPAFDGWDPFIRQGATASDLLRAMEAVRDGPPAARCRELATRNTWDERAVHLLREIAETQRDLDARSLS